LVGRVISLSSPDLQEEQAVIATTATERRPVRTDEQLLARYERGEPAALEELFRRHRQAAFRVAYRCLGQEADALDAVQEGFVKVLRHLDGFHRRSSFKTWLLRIVANAALDLRRRDRRRTTVLEGWRREHGSEQPAAVVAGGLERAELRRLLDEALAALPEAHRQAFVLHTDGELPYREVAEVQGVPIGTVMSRLYYARRKLQAYLFARVLP
jgi:RNA polymerase sigma-70 factor (ECF subfamily)